MNNKIIFSPLEYNAKPIMKHVTEPLRGSQVMAEWIKSIPRFQNDEKEMRSSDTGYHNLTVKHCMPFLDGMSNGYFLTTWTDIYVHRIDGEPQISYRDAESVKFVGPPIQYQKNFPSYIPTMSGFDPFSYVWSTYWRIKTPKGVSCLFTQPMNRTDLPFFTLSGITDTDNWNGSDVLNFALKENFEGLIPKGTPYAQIIPFYRNDWESEISEYTEESMQELRKDVLDKRFSNQSGYYRDKLWQKKSFK
jgi:hypothetical protein